ncbi:MAG: Lectin C-type domain [Pseudomonadota bacterium]|jgi:hypothetical protein
MQTSHLFLLVSLLSPAAVLACSSDASLGSADRPGRLTSDNSDDSDTVSETEAGGEAPEPVRGMGSEIDAGVGAAGGVGSEIDAGVGAAGGTAGVGAAGGTAGVGAAGGTAGVGAAGGSTGGEAAGGSAGGGDAPQTPDGPDADRDGRLAMATAPAEVGGVLAMYDCDDTDQTIFRGAPEVCGDTKDNNCDGMTDEAECIDPVGNVPCQDQMFMGKRYAKCGKGAGNLWTHPKARLVCLMKGMDLAVIESAEENDFIVGLIGDQTWLGGSDQPETHRDYLDENPQAETWRWGMTGKVFFTGSGVAGMPSPAGTFQKWGVTGGNPAQQPSNNSGTYNGQLCREACMVMRTTQGGSWYDICCNHRTGDGVCEARQ